MSKNVDSEKLQYQNATPNEHNNENEVPIHDWQLTKSNDRYLRIRELHDFYYSQFGKEPNFFVRVPGRVNIIGEHVDYCGYPVLPMAVDQCIILAVGVIKDSKLLRLRNLENVKFEDFDCDLQDFSIELPQSGGPAWYKYFLCGIKGISETLGDSYSPMGMNVALSGNIPPASGLSSSSALVSSSVLATAYVHGMKLDRKQLAAISASCERYIGTQGGGMDQAIAYLAKEGCAQFIEFQPKLNATPIELPVGACFVVANSLAESNKAATSDFNERVVECRLASRIIAKRMQLPNWREITRLADLQTLLHCTLVELEELVMKFLPKEEYTRADVCDELNVSEAEFEKDFLTPNTLRMEKFKLRQRALHVIQESLRVARFRAICEELESEYTIKQTSNGSNGNLKDSGDANSSSSHKDKKSSRLETLSLLMRESHRSLRELYQCSHPDLERLVNLSHNLNVGARLSGAGWGGCIVALCDSLASSERYMRELKDKYFAQLPPHLLERYQGNDFSEVIFSTFPRNGAEIFVNSI